MNDIKLIFETLTVGGVGVWTGVVMFAVYLLREWRETRKLSDADKLARRDGYAKQVENLQTENRNLRTDLAKLETQHREYRAWCEEQHDKDRMLIRAMQDELTGIKRAIAAGQVAAMDVLPPAMVPPVIAAAAERSAEFLRNPPATKSEVKS